jgi:hypothetical protein
LPFHSQGLADTDHFATAFELLVAHQTSYYQKGGHTALTECSEVLEVANTVHCSIVVVAVVDIPTAVEVVVEAA